MPTAIRISLEEFIDRPDREDNRREELIEGEVILSPGAKVWHAGIVSRLRDALAPLSGKGYILLNDFACILGSISMPIPDLAVVTEQRFKVAEASADWLQGSPELVVEVSSPSNGKLHRKADIYLEHGAEQVWIIYPKTRTVTVVTPDGSSEARMGETLEFHGVPVQVSEMSSNGMWRLQGAALPS